MKKTRIASLAVALMMASWATAQITSGASNTVATDVPHTTIPYRIEDTGTKLPDIVWGLDQAWISEGNMRRGLNFAGQEMIEVVRLSFQPSASVEGGSLSAAQKAALDERIRIAKYARFATINLNSDPQEGKGVDSWYKTNNATTNGQRWAQLIGLTKKYVEAKGLKVYSISPFNEPDYSDWNQGDKATFRAICKAIRDDSQFSGVLLCGGNVLNPDYALEWYNYSKDYLDEGNTHQLAGTFDNFAGFYQQVVADSKVAVGDELHNTMECMVGSEYGLTKGIWWGTCDHTRSQFMKASRGTRLGYAENRTRWVAGSVYRHAEGYNEGCEVQGFVGTSERQAAASTFRFAALDHDVFYNGQGPARDFIIRTPGTPNPGGYDTKAEYCRNAESVVNIQGGDDIMPALPTVATNYRIVNSFSGHSLAPASNNATSGADMVQLTIARNNPAQHWTVTPDKNDVGGDFSYFTLSNVKDATLYPDVRDWSLEDLGPVILYAGSVDDNEKWFMEYAGNGYFYIRSKHSALYLQVSPKNDNGQTATDTQLKVSGRKVNQGVFTGGDYQKWRLIPVDVAYNKKAPAAPTDLAATPQAASVRLDWTAPADKDLLEYIVLRSEDQSHWYTIHNHVPGTAYIDNTVDANTTYYYKVKAVDMSLNRSDASDAVSGAATGEATCILQVVGDSLRDASVNGNHVALHGTLSQQEGKVGQAINLSSTNNNFLQLPATIANTEELTLCAWLYFRGGNRWQRIFDLGLDTDHYVFLSPSNGNNGKMRLAFKNGGTEQYIETTSLATNRWVHVAVTFADDKVVLYVDGKAAVSNSGIKTRPYLFRPIFNYIGRSQFDSDPLFNGAVNDLRIYNYALTAEEVKDVASLTDGIQEVGATQGHTTTNTIFDIIGRRVSNRAYLTPGIYVINGQKVLVK